MKSKSRTGSLLSGLTEGRSAISGYLRRYLKNHYRGQLGRTHPKEERVASYWRALPLWLAKRPHSTTTARPFLKDVALAQRMLYLSFRIQDDLFDGQTTGNALIFASNRLLIDAEAVFAGYFPKDAKFWRIYRDCLRKTAEAIVEVDRFERTLRTNPNRLLNSHAKVCSLFKIASAAVCARSNRWQSFKQVSAFCDEMAKAGQIIDDLIDLHEDFKRKRYNYAALILHRSLSRDGSQADWYGKWTKLIFQQVGRHVWRAENALKPLQLPEAEQYFLDYKKVIEEIERDLALSRVEKFFAPIVGHNNSKSHHRR